MSAREQIMALLHDGPLAGMVADEILAAHAAELARKQKAFFGDVSSQGNDGNWYGMSDWLMEAQ